MADRENSPGLDLSHGFIHMIRRRQLTEAERLRELAATQAKQKPEHKYSSPTKVKRPDAPLYSRGASLRTRKLNSRLNPPLNTQPNPQSNSQTDDQPNHQPNLQLNPQPEDQPEDQPDSRPNLSNPQWNPQTDNQPLDSTTMLETATNQQEWTSPPLMADADVKRVLDTADIDGFPKYSHDLLTTTIIDMREVIGRVLPEVAEMLVERAYKDKEYCERAAIVCAHIVEAEYVWQDSMAIPDYKFRRALIAQCMDVLDRWTVMSATQTLQNATWADSFCHFVQSAFQLVRPGGEKMDSALSQVMTRLLEVLLQDVKTGKVDKVSHILRILQECGEELQATHSQEMQAMTAAIRDLFFQPTAKPHVRQLLLQIIELSAAQSKPSPYY